ncbi:MAG: tol-pal system-associated acyl-CoA thioesterase [Desulfuromonadales bacterium]|nr:tol-pal system-associated acyl-CoA thioesterase [Desulfuromonadales bacterium]
MECRIYYEDTDAGGVVYHARYLAFFERGRTEFFREQGISVRDFHDKGSVFPVIRMELDFKAPARLDDLLRVDTELVEVGKTSFTFSQKIFRVEDEKLLVKCKVTLVCVGDGMKPKRIPKELERIKACS